MNLRHYVEEKARAARKAARALACLPSGAKDAALRAMADGLEAQEESLLEANRRDVEAARSAGLAAALVDRLTLTRERIAAMARGLREVAALPDPVGEVVRMWRRPNGMEVGKVRVPIGVIGIIYESRPNVTAEAAGLCLKAGNAVILRGGSEALHSNTAIARILAQAGAQAGVPEAAVTVLDRPEREGVLEMLRLEGLIDLVIPRGGPGLMKLVTEHARMPVIKHDKGLCHTYVDRGADLAMAEAIAFNAKVQRPGTCNAMETLLVHRDVAEALLKRLGPRLREAGVEVRGCPETRRLLPWARAATEEDYRTEHLALILNVKVVESMDEALEHIAAHGSQHTEAIVTRDYGRARRFLQEVDASAVMVNASTRLHDGYEFGLGAEIGISTTRLHARGTMGLEELTCTKYIVLGDGQVRT